MHQTLIAVIVLCAVCATLADDMAKAFPTIDSNFFTNTKEVTYTGPDDTTGTTVVEQDLVWDVDLRRSRMYAAGSLVQGAMEQIKRCDIHPEGWMTNAGGARVSDPSSWSCTNMTINAASELPENCQYSSFWTLGGFDQAYAGVEKVNGMNCDKWTYRMQDEGTGKIDDYAFWCAKDHAVPVATGRVGSPTGDGLYTIFFSNFAPGAPAESQFAPQPGSDCPASTPPRDNASAGDAKKNKNKGSISNVNCLHKQAALRQNN